MLRLLEFVLLEENLVFCLVIQIADYIYIWSPTCLESGKIVPPHLSGLRVILLADEQRSISPALYVLTVNSLSLSLSVSLSLSHSFIVFMFDTYMYGFHFDKYLYCL